MIAFVGDRRFDGFSFAGGIVLTLGLTGLVYLVVIYLRRTNRLPYSNLQWVLFRWLYDQSSKHLFYISCKLCRSSENRIKILSLMSVSDYFHPFSTYRLSKRCHHDLIESRFSKKIKYFTFLIQHNLEMYTATTKWIPSLISMQCILTRRSREGGLLFSSLILKSLRNKLSISIYINTLRIYIECMNS